MLQYARQELPTIIDTGNGLYDAYQLCLQKIRPPELCLKLYDEVVVALQHAQLRQ